MSSKKCNKCGVVKPFSELIPNSQCKDGYRPCCRHCNNLHLRKNYRERSSVREGCLKSVRDWQARNRSAIQKYNKEYRAQNRDKLNLAYIDYQLRKKYGISSAEKAEILAQQDGKCAGCGTGDPGIANQTGKKSWHVDHDHKTGERRGILCRQCNLILGMADDDPQVLLGLVTYLARYQALQLSA